MTTTRFVALATFRRTFRNLIQSAYAADHLGSKAYSSIQYLECFFGYCRQSTPRAQGPDDWARQRNQVISVRMRRNRPKRRSTARKTLRRPRVVRPVTNQRRHRGPEHTHSNHPWDIARGVTAKRAGCCRSYPGGVATERAQQVPFHGTVCRDEVVVTLVCKSGRVNGSEC